MSKTSIFVKGGYRYIPGVFQYSAGVAAEPGFRIERLQFRNPLPIVQGFEAAENYLAGIGRDGTAFCACELRSPAPFTEEGFRSFNRDYVGTLQRWGIFCNEENPVARTNVCPEFDKPSEPVMHAFSYTVPTDRKEHGAGFIVAGSGEATEGQANYRDTIVRLGEISPDAIRAKVHFVLQVMEQRLRSLGFEWSDANRVHAYTIHDIGWLVANDFAKPGLVPHGLTWVYSQPPVVDIEFEMDVHGAVREFIA